jgi:hypothetical protein
VNSLRIHDTVLNHRLSSYSIGPKQYPKSGCTVTPVYSTVPLPGYSNIGPFVNFGPLDPFFGLLHHLAVGDLLFAVDHRRRVFFNSSLSFSFFSTIEGGPSLPGTTDLVDFLAGSKSPGWAPPTPFKCPLFCPNQSSALLDRFLPSITLQCHSLPCAVLSSSVDHRVVPLPCQYSFLFIGTTHLQVANPNSHLFVSYLLASD